MPKTYPVTRLEWNLIKTALTHLNRTREMIDLVPVVRIGPHKFDEIKRRMERLLKPLVLKQRLILAFMGQKSTRIYTRYEIAVGALNQGRSTTMYSTMRELERLGLVEERCRGGRGKRAWSRSKEGWVLTKARAAMEGKSLTQWVVDAMRGAL